MKRTWWIAFILLAMLYIASTAIAWFSAADAYDIAGNDYDRASIRADQTQTIDGLDDAKRMMIFARCAMLAFIPSVILVLFLSASIIVVTRGRKAIMLHKPKNIPPEPYFSAALYLLHQVALFIRNYANKISHEQLSDLGDAIHNVPESLTEYGYYFDEQMIRDIYLAAYDKKWANSSVGFSLLRTLDDGIMRVERWRDGA